MCLNVTVGALRRCGCEIKGTVLVPLSAQPLHHAAFQATRLSRGNRPNGCRTAADSAGGKRIKIGV